MGVVLGDDGRRDDVYGNIGKFVVVRCEMIKLYVHRRVAT